MKIICMDCQNETHLELEMLKDKKKMVCAHCEEHSQAAPSGNLDGWSAPTLCEGPKGSDPAGDYAFELIEPQVDEADVLEIPEKGAEFYDPERVEAEDLILCEPEASPSAEEPGAGVVVEAAPEQPVVAAAEVNAELAPAEAWPLVDSSPRQDAAPVQVIETVAPVGPPPRGKVKLLEFSAAGVSVGLTAFLAFILLGDRLIKSHGSDIVHVTAASPRAVDSPVQRQDALAEPTPAPRPSSTQAPTPEPTPEPTPAQTPTPQQVETAPAPSVAAPEVRPEGRFGVQVGSYNEIGRANERADKLRAAGFDPRVVSVELPRRGVWHRVVVGSFNDRAEANRFGAQLRAKGAAQDFVIAEL